MTNTSPSESVCACNDSNGVNTRFDAQNHVCTTGVGDEEVFRFDLTSGAIDFVNLSGQSISVNGVTISGLTSSKRFAIGEVFCGDDNDYIQTHEKTGKMVNGYLALDTSDASRFDYGNGWGEYFYTPETVNSLGLFTGFSIADNITNATSYVYSAPTASKLCKTSLGQLNNTSNFGNYGSATYSNLNPTIASSLIGPKVTYNNTFAAVGSYNYDKISLAHWYCMQKNLGDMLTFANDSNINDDFFSLGSSDGSFVNSRNKVYYYLPTAGDLDAASGFLYQSGYSANSGNVLENNQAILSSSFGCAGGYYYGHLFSSWKENGIGEIPYVHNGASNRTYYSTGYIRDTNAISFTPLATRCFIYISGYTPSDSSCKVNISGTGATKVSGNCTQQNW